MKILGHRYKCISHYDAFGGELYFLLRRGCPRDMEFCKGPQLPKELFLDILDYLIT
jgi:hypothetical protein